MRQNYGKSTRAERLIQYAIEVFDLVEIVPAASVERSISCQFLRPDIASATRYDGVEVKSKKGQGALALNSRVC